MIQLRRKRSRSLATSVQIILLAQLSPVNCRKTSFRVGFFKVTFSTLAGIRAILVSILPGAEVPGGQHKLTSTVLDNMIVVDKAIPTWGSMPSNWPSMTNSRSPPSLACNSCQRAFGQDWPWSIMPMRWHSDSASSRVMRCVENAGAVLGQLADEVQDSDTGLGVDTHGGFVKQQQLGTVQQGTAQVDAPLHAAGVFFDDVFATVGQIQCLNNSAARDLASSRESPASLPQKMRFSSPESSS